MTTIRGLIAVDFSATVLYNIVKGDASILQFFQLPPCILSCIPPGIQRFDENMPSHGLEYILVLDGMPHPKKYAFILRRKESKDVLNTNTNTLLILRRNTLFYFILFFINN